LKYKKILTIIQARLGSTRLPEKVMLPLAGKPLLIRMVERVKSAAYAGKVIIATSTNKEDDLIVKVAEKEGIPVFRGDSLNLLDRHYKAARHYNADIVVKIPSDCPLIDPSVINKVIYYYLDNASIYDYVSNLHPPSYPDGNDVEIFPVRILEIAWKEAAKAFEKEHTTPFIWEHRERFRIGNVNWETGLNYSLSHRWTIDYQEDYEFLKKVYDQLYPQKKIFSMYDILNLLHDNPELNQINNQYLGVNWYRHHIKELKTIKVTETKEIDEYN
jgi:spore coat polysaccharide biosynthesis protein SpsF